MVTRPTVARRLLQLTVVVKKKRQAQPTLLSWLLVVGLFCPGLFCPIAAAASEATRLVVVLYPDDNDGRPGNLMFDRSVRSVLMAESPDRVEIHSEYLDLSRASSPNYPQQLAEFLRSKFAGRQVDAVVAGLTPALDFALEYRTVAFPSAPIVLGAIDESELLARELPDDVVGVPIVMDVSATLDLALRLHPETRRVYVVSGSSRFDRQWEAEARRNFQAREGNPEFVYLSGLALTELQKTLERLPEQSLIYYLHMFQDRDGSMLVPADVLRLLATTANAPIYAHVDSYIGRGIVGGRVFSWDVAGQNAGQVVLRLLAGEAPEQIGVSAPAANADVFDWTQMRRWGLSEASLPAGSIILHRTPSLWDSYKWQIVGVLALCVLQGLTIAGMLVQRLQRTRAERRFRQAVDAAPMGMLMVDQHGHMVLANAEVERLFGYTREQLLGQPVELLMPQRLQGRHRGHRDDYFSAPAARPMGVGRDLFGRHRDGHEFPVEVGLSPVRTELGPFVLASIIDITERRQAEQSLRESQNELRVLTGRLLTAQEEERRRIARELHDDFSQTLALLSVQMDMLRRQPPDSLQFGVTIDELSAGVKQLSSSLHDLSHQLHPFKLEQMGLVAAIRGLCQELTQSHGLPIEFVADPALPPQSQELAVCLYRIVQEALRNVIRHSRAHLARVELRGSENAIYLAIVDDGCGFDSSQVDDQGGLGLVSMRERLRLVGGELAVHTEPERGTRIEVHVPRGTAG